MIVTIKVTGQLRCTKIARKYIAERIDVKNFSSVSSRRSIKVTKSRVGSRTRLCHVDLFVTRSLQKYGESIH